MSRQYLSLLLLILVGVFNSGHTKANHFIGGEMYYEYIGSNNYEFHVLFYRDCGGSFASLDSLTHFAVYNQSNVLLQNVEAGHDPINILGFAQNYSFDCPVTTIDTCVQYVTYSAIINLPPLVGGYTVAYQRCCLNTSVLNVVDMDNLGFTLKSHVPGSETGANLNSSPSFNNHFPFVICLHETLTFDHSAADPDGDSLSYSIVSPLSGGNTFTPNPNPASPPPYQFFLWELNYSSTSPLGIASTCSIDNNTGLLSFYPEQIGAYSFTLLAEEFRAGSLINETQRSIILEVFPDSMLLSSIHETTIKNYNLYPNPTSDFVYISSTADSFQLRLVDASGKFLFSTDVLDTYTSIDLTEYENGIYFLEINCDGKIVTEKIIKK